MNPVYPARMIAGCAHGHHWPVDVTWTPLQLELPADVCQHIQVPTTQPRYCAQCFLDRRGACSAIFLRHLPEVYLPAGAIA